MPPRRAAAFYTLSRAASPWARHSARNSRADAVRNLSRWCTRRNLRERSSPSTRNTATCPFSSASAAMRRGSTATPRPRVAAFTSASVLVDSPYRRDREARGRGRAVELLAGAAAFFAQQKALDAEGVQRHGLALRKGTARRADDRPALRHLLPLSASSTTLHRAISICNSFGYNNHRT